MTRTLRTLLISGIVLALSAAAFAEPIELRLKDGTRWRGDTGDAVRVVALESGVEIEYQGTISRSEELYLDLKTVVAGKKTQKIIFKADIISIEALDESAPDSKAGTSGKPKPAMADLKAADLDDEVKRGPDGKIIPPKPGVFVLEMSGMVGMGIRAAEIEMLREHINKNYGPGQIVVIIVDTNGGLVIEAEKIDDSLVKLQKDGHRVIAWVKKAISAGAMLSVGCQEIYFMTEGTCGSVTTLAGGRSAPEPQQEHHTEQLVKVMTRNGYSEHIARAMKQNKYVCSYDKDPVTGQVTFYGDKSGQHVLSDENQNLTFNSKNAEHCGFSKGTADRPEDLAKLLDLPEWYEIDTYGREISERWQATAERAEFDIQLIARRLNYKGLGSGDRLEILGTQVQLIQQAINWWHRAPEVAFLSLPPKEELERQVERLRKVISDIRRAQRRR